MRPQQSLYFMGRPLGLSLPQGQGSLRPGFFIFFTGCFFCGASPPTLAAAFLETLLRSSFSSLRMRTTKRRRTVSSRMPRIMASNISKPSFL